MLQAGTWLVKGDAGRRAGRQAGEWAGRHEGPVEKMQAAPKERDKGPELPPRV